MDRPANLNATIIDQAYAAGDKETVLEAYLDVLDYKREITKRETFVKVLDSMEFEKFIDHVTFGHIKEQMERLGFDSRLY